MNLEPIRFPGDQARTTSQHQVEALLARLLADGVEATARLIPRVHSCGRTVAKRLGVETPRLFIIPEQSMNAACALPGGGSDKCVVILHSLLVERLSDNELLFALGHELGHAILGHSHHRMDFHEDIGIQHFAELSADRSGLCACNDEADALRALLKIASGLPDLELGEDLSAFQAQVHEIGDLKAHARRGDTHPFSSLRAANISLFSRTNFWRNIRGLEGGTTIQSCNESVWQLYVDTIPEATEGHSSMRLAYWASLHLLTIDGVLDGSDVEVLRHEFGSELASRALGFASGFGHEAGQAAAAKMMDVASKRHGQMSLLEWQSLLAIVSRAATASGNPGDAFRSVMEKLSFLRPRDPKA